MIKMTAASVLARSTVVITMGNGKHEKHDPGGSKGCSKSGGGFALQREALGAKGVQSRWRVFWLC
ncbi:MAG: hypothetical protein AB1749_13510 [Pseudomonadota bacterium]